MGRVETVGILPGENNPSFDVFQPLSRGIRGRRLQMVAVATQRLRPRIGDDLVFVRSPVQGTG